MVKKRAMNAHMKTALDERQFRLALQPIFSAQSGKLASAEALVRWTHPVHGDISPARFIPLAEESGQIYEIGAYVMRQAITFAGQLGTVPIAINVSPLQFRNNNFAKTVADALLEANLSPKLIKIEITEGVLIKHTDAARTTLRQLRELGVQVVLDDFGTGFSSLSYLQNFPFDAIKIDRSFLRNLGTRSQATQLMRTMIELGHSQDMEVVAEGVENAWQISVLQLLGLRLSPGLLPRHAGRRAGASRQPDRCGGRQGRRPRPSSSRRPAATCSRCAPLSADHQTFDVRSGPVGPCRWPRAAPSRCMPSWRIGREHDADGCDNEDAETDGPGERSARDKQHWNRYDD